MAAGQTDKERRASRLTERSALAARARHRYFHIARFTANVLVCNSLQFVAYLSVKMRTEAGRVKMAARCAPEPGRAAADASCLSVAGRGTRLRH